MIRAREILAEELKDKAEKTPRNQKKNKDVKNRFIKNNNGIISFSKSI